VADDHALLPPHIRLDADEEVLVALRPWMWIIWWKHVLTLGLYELWRRRHVLALTNKRVIATQGFIFSKFDRNVRLRRVQDATRERTFFWAHVRVSSAGGELGDLGKRRTLFGGIAAQETRELRWGPYPPIRARRFVERVNELVRAQGERRAAPERPASPAEKDAADTLRELAELRDAGLITVAEFEAKKAEVLARI
jgi:hypothetical protein